ncbi:MAG: sodium-dependent bicarbonate transport family permease, partial [Deltaproteobacteria bacterium]|nr:sodium-dependent bicarbonate transport family permease [Deltaproteobacteria bacterium]
MFYNLGQTLLSPMVLAFILGVFATLIKSDLKFPEEIYIALTIFLLFAIGLKGGYKISQSSLSEALGPMAMAVGLGLSIPLWSYWVLRRLCKMDVTNAAAVAAHYGSVSAVTFGEGIAFLDSLKVFHEGYLPAMLAIMEI